MVRLGFERFHVASHDRGGRVAQRLALDHPGRVRALAVLDIAPTLAMYTTTDMDFAAAYYHWFFLIQPFDLPERLIGADPAYFLRRKIGHRGRDEAAFTDEAKASTCGASRPRRSTPRVRTTGRRQRSISTTTAPTSPPAGGWRVRCWRWGAKGYVGGRYDVVDGWRAWADDVGGWALPSGDFVAEEAPRETLAGLLTFFTGDG